MKPAARWPSILFWLTIAALLVYRPLYTLGIPFSCFSHAQYDDGIFLRSAIALREGHWLGAYDPLTLCKGPFYPMFVALVSWIPLPLTLLEQGFYSVIALIAAWSVRPAISNRWLLLAGFALLVINPYSWGALPARLTRDPMAAQLSLLTAAGVIGMILRMNGRWHGLLTWAALAGTAGAACWMTREEGIWIIGPLALLLVIAAATYLYQRKGCIWHASIAIVAPAVIGSGLVLSVCAQNFRHYGVFAIVDLKTQEFRDAYGALLRVGEKHYRHHVPVPRDARLAMYDVSPTFRKLQPLLEGELGEHWTRHRQMPHPQDMQGGWFVWAFREAAQLASGVVGAPPLEMYRKIADEVNAACDAGTIPGGKKRSTLVTPLNRAEVGELFGSFAANLWDTVTWPRYRGDTISADDSSDGALRTRQLVHMPLTGPHNLHMVEGWACAADGPITLAVLRKDGTRGKFKPQWLFSPDVAEYLRNDGKDWPTAEQCRFIHPTSRHATHLLIFDGDQQIAQVPLRGENRMLLEEKVAASIDSISEDPIPPVPGHKRALKLTIDTVYCYLASVLSVLMVGWVAVAAATMRRTFLWLCMSAALLGAIVLRSALLAYLDATTYEIYEQRYVEASFTVMAFAIFISMCGLWRYLQARRQEKSQPDQAPALHS